MQQFGQLGRRAHRGALARTPDEISLSHVVVLGVCKMKLGRLRHVRNMFASDGEHGVGSTSRWGLPRRVAGACPCAMQTHNTTYHPPSLGLAPASRWGSPQRVAGALPGAMQTRNAT